MSHSLDTHVPGDRVPDGRVPDGRVPDGRVPDGRVPDDSVFDTPAFGMPVVRPPTGGDVLAGDVLDTPAFGIPVVDPRPAATLSPATLSPATRSMAARTAQSPPATAAPPAHPGEGDVRTGGHPAVDPAAGEPPRTAPMPVPRPVGADGFDLDPHDAEDFGLGAVDAADLDLRPPGPHGVGRQSPAPVGVDRDVRAATRALRGLSGAAGPLDSRSPATRRSRAGAPPATGPRLLAGWQETGLPADLVEHHGRYGRLPLGSRAGRSRVLIEQVADAGLTGRGGAGFSTARKLAAVAAARRRPVVLVNGCEGEPASAKDATLLDLAPHLVLDGAVLVAHALGAPEATVCVHEGSAAARSLQRAIDERDDPVGLRVLGVPHRYVTGQASALVRFVDASIARPTTSPPRMSERGVGRRPTLVDNVETLAHLALIARYGPGWYRTEGTSDAPGTYLVTVGGEVAAPGVYEVAGGIGIEQVLDVAGGPLAPLQAVLAGGYAGSWLVPDAPHTPPIGPGSGLAMVHALAEDACGLTQAAHLLRYLAGESARQCGPCTFGLPAVAADLAEIAVGRGSPGTLERLAGRLGVIPGRGACALPDGACRMAASALEVFAADLDEHLAGRPCPDAGRPAMFPIPRRS